MLEITTPTGHSYRSTAPPLPGTALLAAHPQHRGIRRIVKTLKC
jgi:hypothetical protein